MAFARQAVCDLVFYECHILCFTDRGEELAARLSGFLMNRNPDSKELIAKATRVEVHRVKDLGATVERLFKTGQVLVFIGAAGIAVRAIAPLLQGKDTDPAVIVIDEKAHFVIPLLSGHIGRANAAGRMIADQLSATLVLTTATDVNGVFSFDAFASEYGYLVANPDAIKTIASAMLGGRQIGLQSDFEIHGQLPKLVRHEESGLLGVLISSDLVRKPFSITLHLVPKYHHVGIGARRGIGTAELESFFLDTLTENGINTMSVASISSVDLKHDEAAIIELAYMYRVPFVTHTARQLSEVADRFRQSDFVASVVGTGNVSEAAAYLSSDGGEIVVPKTIRGGITIAVARANWVVDFGLEESDVAATEDATALREGYSVTAAEAGRTEVRL